MMLNIPTFELKSDQEVCLPLSQSQLKKLEELRREVIQDVESDLLKVLRYI